MSANIDVELVLKYNMKIQKVQSTWAPVAASTPISRPVITSSNSKLLNRTKNYELDKMKDGKIALQNEDSRDSLHGNRYSCLTVKGNENKRWHKYFSDDSDDETTNLPKKPLLIKSGQGNRSIRNRSKNITANHVSPSIKQKVHKQENTSEAVEKVKVSKKNSKVLQIQRIKEKSKENKPHYSSGPLKNSKLETKTRKYQSISTKGVSGRELRKKVHTKQNNVSDAEEKEARISPKLSISHEIFSDTREREFRDSVDLTDCDISINQPLNELLNKKRARPKSKTLNTEIKQGSASKNEAKEATEKLMRPKRTKKSPKEFWLPKSDISKCVELKSDDVENNSSEIKQVAPPVPKLNQLPESENISNKLTAAGNTEDIEEVLNGNIAKTETANGFVKDLSELEFAEHDAGDGKGIFSVAVGWHFSSYKCCALKIKVNCAASGRTSNETSHFGGVVLKGRLLMYIKGKELKIKSGQMFYVPPLTDWKAVNNCKTECIIYYWCGKFS